MKKLFRTLYKKKSLLVVATMMGLVCLLMFYPPKSGEAKSSGPGDDPVQTTNIRLFLNSYQNELGNSPLQQLDSGCPLSLFPLSFGAYNTATNTGGLNFPPDNLVDTQGLCQYASMRVTVNARDYNETKLIGKSKAEQFGSQSNYIQITVPSDREYEISVGLYTRQFTTCIQSGLYGGCAISNAVRKVRFDYRKTFNGSSAGDIFMDMVLGTGLCGNGNCVIMRRGSSKCDMLNP
ncbi:MAG: hypothetical protein EAZ44_01430 [Cytophagia bacterium]|nr:MAG: hypothetical protein EAZ44_01430 [Cytophagia bacterium]TAG43494.1 MAG: hypothetical protein EAZ31_04070 [Cytophagia bacterium]TAH29790.1 MAG: hypothetical protein EAZ06_05550 [Cytophagales bacterium]